MKKCKVNRSSGVGGQAVIEGVMMRHKDTYAVAVRKPDGEIEVETEEFEGVLHHNKIKTLYDPRQLRHHLGIFLKF